jgi:two-component system, OmpR family, phosphate regulon sensor histidine kinase PhoR
MAILWLFSSPEPIQVSVAPVPVDAIESAVIAAIAEPVLLVIDNRVRAANTAATTLLGAHIVGEDIRLAIRHPAASAQLAADAKDGSVELLGIGGREQQVELNVATIAPGKRVVHLIDRAARHAVEQARVDFVANASHELRTPLAAILGFIETLADDNAGGDASVRARFLEVMFKEARRMQRLIDDLISLSRIEAEKYVIPDETVSIPALLREVTGELRDQQGDKPTQVILEIDTEIADVIGERAQLSQVVHNLVGNAIKYGRADAPVRVSVKADGALVRLTVSDEGEGIAPEHLPRLTERFYRVDAGRSRSMGGTGLGLAIVKHIVERHRARLEISSVPGTGTTVSIVFPAATQVTVTETSPN